MDNPSLRGPVQGLGAGAGAFTVRPMTKSISDTMRFAALSNTTPEGVRRAAVEAVLGTDDLELITEVVQAGSIPDGLEGRFRGHHRAEVRVAFVTANRDHPDKLVGMAHSERAVSVRRALLDSHGLAHEDVEELVPELDKMSPADRRNAALHVLHHHDVHAHSNLEAALVGMLDPDLIGSTKVAEMLRVRPHLAVAARWSDLVWKHIALDGNADTGLRAVALANLRFWGVDVVLSKLVGSDMPRSLWPTARNLALRRGARVVALTYQARGGEVPWPAPYAEFAAAGRGAEWVGANALLGVDWVEEFLSHHDVSATTVVECCRRDAADLATAWKAGTVRTVRPDLDAAIAAFLVAEEALSRTCVPAEQLSVGLTTLARSGVLGSAVVSGYELMGFYREAPAELVDPILVETAWTWVVRLPYSVVTTFLARHLGDRVEAWELFGVLSDDNAEWRTGSLIDTALAAL